MIRKILKRAANWAHSLSHFGRLGKTAANRAFLRKEKKKLLVKLGEGVVEWAKHHPEAPHEVKRIVEQIHKIDGMLSKLDFGGEDGVDFVETEGHAKRKASRRRAGHQD